MKKRDYSPADLFAVVLGYVATALMLLAFVSWLVGSNA